MRCQSLRERRSPGAVEAGRAEEVLLRTADSSLAGMPVWRRNVAPRRDFRIITRDYGSPGNKFSRRCWNPRFRPCERAGGWLQKGLNRWVWHGVWLASVLTGRFHCSSLSLVNIIKRNMAFKGELMACRVPRGMKGCLLLLALVTGAGTLSAQTTGLAVSIDGHGRYSIAVPGQEKAVLVAGVAAKIDGQWLHSSDYPKHDVESRSAEGYWGKGQEWQVTFSGLTGKPELLYRIRDYDAQPFADIVVTVRNTTGRPVGVQALRAVESRGGGVAVPGTPAADRVLSDSFSEDRPAMQLRYLGNAELLMHRAVGRQLIYNRP